jgi:CheY-like chemotaxis protein
MASYPKIIYVEDNPQDAELFRHNLERCGVGVEVITMDDTEALDFLTQTASEDTKIPDVLVLDLKMPEQSGISLLMQIKRIPQFDATPVVILSGSMGPSDKSEALRQGASLCLEKPRTAKDWDDIVSGISSFLVS